MDKLIAAVTDIISRVTPEMASERARNIVQGLAFSDELGLESQFIICSGLRELNKDRGVGTRALGLSEDSLTLLTEEILASVAEINFKFE